MIHMQDSSSVCVAPSELECGVSQRWPGAAGTGRPQHTWHLRCWVHRCLCGRQNWALWCLPQWWALTNFHTLISGCIIYAERIVSSRIVLFCCVHASILPLFYWKVRFLLPVHYVFAPPRYSSCSIYQHSSTCKRYHAQSLSAFYMYLFTNCLQPV